ncbi:MAG: ornithine cyclodeaminase family protein [Saprospiraceae bacterium]
MLNISKEQLEGNLDYLILIEALQNAFQEKYIVPIRHHHNYQNPKEGIESTLLLMPAWQAGEYLGVKMVTVSPKNGQYNLPSIHGIYTLFDAQKGMPLAQINATTLTAQRTAATSALASSFLSKKNSKTLLMVGTGALAPELIQAHAVVRPIETVYVWGRNLEKAKAVVNSITKHFQKIEKKKIEFFPIENIEAGIEKADIISCATLSSTPLILGKKLKAGQHLDLVGAYRPDMREADDEAILRSSVFVDTYDGMNESGDISIPLESGILKKENVCADLFELCRSEKTGRKDNEQITFFKSVGHALEDLTAAKLIYEKLSPSEF